VLSHKASTESSSNHSGIGSAATLPAVPGRRDLVNGNADSVLAEHIQEDEGTGSFQSPSSATSATRSWQSQPHWIHSGVWSAGHNMNRHLWAYCMVSGDRPWTIVYVRSVASVHVLVQCGGGEFRMGGGLGL